MSNVPKELERILSLIESRNLSEKKVLNDCDIGTSFFSDWKSGRLKSPSIDKIKRIASYLGVSVDYLLGREEIDYEITSLHRIFDLCKQKGIEPRVLLKLLGIGDQVYSKWMLYSEQPSKEQLQQFADYFGVTTDYLLGREKEPTLDEQLQGVLFAAHGGDTKKFTDEQKQSIINFVNFIKSQNEGDDTK